MDSAHLGGDRQHAQRPGLPGSPTGLTGDRAPVPRTWPGSLRPRLPLPVTYTPGTFEGWLHRITTNLFLDMVRRKQRIRFDALGDDAAERLPSHSPPHSRSSTTRTSTRTSSRRWTPSRRVPRRRRPLRRRTGTRRSPRPWASSSVRSAAGSTVAVRSCARPWHTGLPRPCRARPGFATAGVPALGGGGATASSGSGPTLRSGVLPTSILGTDSPPWWTESSVMSRVIVSWPTSSPARSARPRRTPSAD